MFDSWEDPRPDLIFKTFPADAEDIEGLAFGNYENQISDLLEESGPKLVDHNWDIAFAFEAKPRDDAPLTTMLSVEMFEELIKFE